MSELHVAAMPFPTFQGTQAAVRAYCEARTMTHAAPELLTYGGGVAPEPTLFPWHRTELSRPLAPKSGPSLGKLRADVGLARELRSLTRARRFDRVVAHHVEAAFATVVSVGQPCLFLAHTSVGLELPTYGPRALARVFREAGSRLDRFLLRRCAAVAAVSPRLAKRLGEASDREVTYLPIPWLCPSPIQPAERVAAQRELRLDAPAVLYSGNLDAYQGVAEMIAAITKVPRPVTLIVHTAANPRIIRRIARRHGLDRMLRIVEMTGEAGRRQVAAAASVAIVPRRVEGGAPVKLLDALSRGIPTVAMCRATGGLRVTGAAEVVDNHPAGVARGIERVLADEAYQEALRTAGPRYIRMFHAPESVSGQFDAICSSLEACSTSAEPLSRRVL